MFGRHKGKEKRKKVHIGTMAKLEDMLDDALNGHFNEENYDESRFSRLEVKWKRFLSSQVSARQKLLEEQGRIKSLISDISHQTKTPLANIMLYAQLLEEKERDPELVPMVEKIREQSEKLDFLIRSLIKTSRLESEVLMLQPVQQPIAPMLLAVVNMMQEEAAKKQIKITVEDTDAKACFDRKWTEEAIGNLLDNAVKYSPPGSRVQIKVTDYEMFAAVSVKDQGIGIREEEQAKIFKRFYRSKEVAQAKGVGIGLYLAREIAEKQNGYLKVKSKHGKGSTFSFYMIKNER